MRVEVISSGCSDCREFVDRVRKLVGSAGEVRVLDFNDRYASARACALGVRSLPALVVNGRLVEWREGREPSHENGRRRASG